MDNNKEEVVRMENVEHNTNISHMVNNEDGI